MAHGHFIHCWHTVGVSQIQAEERVEGDSCGMVGNTGRPEANGASHKDWGLGREPTTRACFRRVAKENFRLDRVNRRATTHTFAHNPEARRPLRLKASVVAGYVCESAIISRLP